MKAVKEIQQEVVLTLKNEAMEQVKKYEGAIKQELLKDSEAQKFLIHHINNNEKLEGLLNEKDYFNFFNLIFNTHFKIRTKLILNEIQEHYNISHEINKERKTISIYLEVK